MHDNDSKGFSYTSGFFMLIAFMIAASFFAAAMSQPIWSNLTGKSLEALALGDLTASDGTALKIMQVLNALVGFLLPTLVAAQLLNKRPLKLIGFDGQGMEVKQLLLVVLIFGAALVASNALSYITHSLPITPENKILVDKMEERYNQQVGIIVTAKSFGEYLVSLIVMALLPALCEEVLFRGGMQNFLTRGTGRPWMSIIIVSVIFSIMHISYYGFFSRIALGMVLGALYYYSGTIWWSIIAHFLNNALAVTMLYIYTQQGKSIKEAMNDNVDNYWGILALIPLIGLFILFKKSAAKSRRSHA